MNCVVVLTEVKELRLQQLSINHPYLQMRTHPASLPTLASGKLRAMALVERLGIRSVGTVGPSGAGRQTVCRHASITRAAGRAR